MSQVSTIQFLSSKWSSNLMSPLSHFLSSRSDLPTFAAPLLRTGRIFVVVVHFAENSDLVFPGVIGVIFLLLLLHGTAFIMLGRLVVTFPKEVRVYQTMV